MKIGIPDKGRKNLVVVESTAKAERLRTIMSKDSKIDWRFYVFEDKLFIGKKLVEGSYVVSSTFDQASYNFKIELSGVENIWIATDPDEEGEAIASIINDKAMRYSEAKIRRVRLNDLTEDHVRLSFATPEMVDKNLADSWWTRNQIYQWQESKLAIGIGNVLACSPVQKERIYSHPIGLLLLSFIEGRETEIRSFVSQPLYKVSCSICKGTAQAVSLGFTLKEDAQKHLEKIQDAIDEKTIEAVYLEQRAEFRIPQPYITKTILKHLCTKYSISTAKALKYLRYLYEKGDITFYKTGSKSLHRKFSEYLWKKARADGYLMADKPKQYSDSEAKGEFIRITSYRGALPELSMANRIYNDITKRVINIQLRPAKLVRQKVTYSVDGNLLLEAKGEAVEQTGLYEPSEKRQSLNEGFLRRFGELSIVEHHTEAPKRLTRVDLYDWMLTYNVTHINLFEEIISNLLNHHYITFVGDDIHLTAKGEIILTALRDLNTETEDCLFFSQLEEDLKDLAIANKTVEQIGQDYGELGYEVLKTVALDSKQLRVIPKFCKKCKKSKCLTQIRTRNISKYCGVCDTCYRLVLDRETKELDVIEYVPESVDLDEKVSLTSETIDIDSIVEEIEAEEEDDILDVMSTNMDEPKED